MPGIHRKERENRKRKTHLTHTGLLMEGIHRKERENRKRKTHLTHTGLLMEGVGQVFDLAGPARFEEECKLTPLGQRNQGDQRAGIPRTKS
jgi:hypothetical protein